jgi:hypothetical protein
MWKCLGTEQHNPLTDMIFKVMSGMGFDVKAYDPAFPLIESSDRLDDYLRRIDTSLWEITDNSDLRVGDTAIFVHEHGTSGKLLNESGINVGPVINSDMQIPLMRGMKSSIHGVKKLSEILLAGYAVTHAVRPKHFNNFKEISSAKELISALRNGETK